ncbi:MAG: hypothetical protein OXC25_11240 [Thiotrichales bacterium]|nr:hypothetical protein [Thiotrichales bacterium]
MAAIERNIETATQPMTRVFHPEDYLPTYGSRDHTVWCLDRRLDEPLVRRPTWMIRPVYLVRSLVMHVKSLQLYPISFNENREMADTRVQTKVEDWVRCEWMSERFGQRFSRERLGLSSGGVFDFDAVSSDGSIVANISTSGSRTASGKHAVGKMLKVRSDIFFLLLVQADRKLVLLTERDMYDRWLSEVESGRVPASIEFVHVDIPDHLETQLQASRRAASREVTPSRED